MHNTHTPSRLYLDTNFEHHLAQNNLGHGCAEKMQENVDSGFLRHPKMQQFQYYSFKQSQKSDQNQEFLQQQQVSCQDRSQRSCNTYKSKEDLLQKYESLCDRLREIQPNEVVYLFIEQIQQNERSKRQLSLKNRKLISMDETIAQLEHALEQKRKAIRKMCETQSKNLDIIECLESKLRDQDFDFAEHYQNKYRQLEQYMNEYINSNGQAQEQMYKKISLLKNQNERLASENQTMNRSFFEKSKLLGILELRQLKCETALSQSKEEKKLFERQLQRLEEENNLLRKDVQTLIETIKSYEQFEMQLNNKSNRQFSSSLQFIREKLNSNTNAPLQQSFMNGHPKEASKLYFSKESEQIEGLKMKVQLLTQEKDQLQKHNHQLMQDYQGLCQKVTKLANQNSHFQKTIESNQKEVIRLRMQAEAAESLKSQCGKLDKNAFGINFSNAHQSLSLSSLKIQNNSGCESLASLGKAYVIPSNFHKFDTKNKQNSTAHVV